MLFYGVKSRFYDDKETAELLDGVHAIVKPEQEKKLTKDYDEYVDYFHTLEEAMDLVNYVNGRSA